MKFLSSDPSLSANALGNNSAKLDWPKVKPFGALLEFVELNAEMVVHTDGLWEDVFTFWTCLRCDFPQFDIMRANGAPPPSTSTKNGGKKGDSESCQLCKILGGGRPTGGKPSKGGKNGK